MSVSKKVELMETQIRDACKNSRHSKCAALIDSLPEMTKETSHYQILKASCLNNIVGRCKEARSILEAVIGEDPKNPLALFGKGLVYINEGNFKEALKCFEQAIVLEPSEKMDKARVMKAKVEEMIEKMLTKKRNSAKTNETSSCKICGKILTTNFSLNRHMLLHTGERPFKCAVCKYGFIQKSDLFRHESTHRAEYNFHCLSCTKKFKTKKNLQCHLSTHSKERLFHCPHCSKSFKLQRVLRFHVETHKEKNRLQCDLCAKTFTRKMFMETHIKTFHLRYDRAITLKPLEIKPEPIENEYLEENNHEVEPELIETRGTGEENLSFANIIYEPIVDFDMEFLRSLLKDIKRMDIQQKQKFQRKTRELIDNILN